MSVTFSKSFIYGQVIFWSAAGLAIAVFLGYQLNREFERIPYKSQIGKYLEQPQDTLSERFKLPKDLIVISGKLVVVNLKDKSIDPIFNDLPKELKPENPDQVKTVLWIQCNPQPSYRKYIDGSTSYNNVCSLTFIDLISKKYLWKDTVTVSPPLSKKMGTDHNVIDPSDNILSYLQNIPHKD